MPISEKLPNQHKAKKRHKNNTKIEKDKTTFSKGFANSVA